MLPKRHSQEVRPFRATVAVQHDACSLCTNKTHSELMKKKKKKKIRSYRLLYANENTLTNNTAFLLMDHSTSYIVYLQSIPYSPASSGAITDLGVLKIKYINTFFIKFGCIQLKNILLWFVF